MVTYRTGRETHHFSVKLHGASFALVGVVSNMTRDLAGCQHASSEVAV